MAEYDCEIEYLDEDEDVVQQYVHGSQPAPEIAKTSVDIEEQIPSLLMVRKRAEKKEKFEEDDSDYDPSEDLEFLRNRKKMGPKRTPKIYTNLKPRNISLVPRVQLVEKPAKTTRKTAIVPKTDINTRKMLDIRVPDYEDPICLPVRAINQNEKDLKWLKRWNNLCLDRFMAANKELKPDKGTTKSSTRTVVIRHTQNNNFFNENYGKYETTVWCKTNVTSESGMNKSEILQSILPRYREKKILPPYKLLKGPRMAVNNTYEVILTKEEHKEEETLVAYNAREAVSAVYRAVGNKSTEDDNSEGEAEKDTIALREVACMRVCAPCYQVSWRGIRKTKKTDQKIRCRICSISFISLYNLLTHLKAHHTHADVRKHKKHLATTLAELVEYHYKCRICQEQFLSIKDLRKHVHKHQGDAFFQCDVCNHRTR